MIKDNWKSKNMFRNTWLYMSYLTKYVCSFILKCAVPRKGFYFFQLRNTDWSICFPVLWACVCHNYNTNKVCLYREYSNNIINKLGYDESSIYNFSILGEPQSVYRVCTCLPTCLISDSYSFVLLPLNLISNTLKFNFKWYKS